MARKITARSFAKNFSIAFNGLPMEMNGDLVQAKKSKSKAEEEFVSVSPHDLTRKLRRIYYDDVEQCEVAWGDVQKARELDDGTLVVVEKDDIAAAKKSELPERVLTLEVFKAEEVGDKLLPGANRYLFMPNSLGPAYGFLQRFLREKPDYVLIGRANLGARSGEKILQLVLGLNGHLMVSELIWPEDVNEFDPAPEAECSDKVFAMSEQIIDALCEPFNADEWKKESRVRLSKLVASAQGDGAVVVGTTPVPKPSAAQALEDLLAKQLENISKTA